MKLTAIFCVFASALAFIGCGGESSEGDVKSTENDVKSTESDEKGATLSFSSFDGGGPQFSVKIDDPDVLAAEQTRKYGNPRHAEMDGSPFDVVFRFTGLKPGETTLTISARSPIADNFDARYNAKVDASLSVSLEEIETTDFDPNAPLEEIEPTDVEE